MSSRHKPLSRPAARLYFDSTMDREWDIRWGEESAYDESSGPSDPHTGPRRLETEWDAVWEDAVLLRVAAVTQVEANARHDAEERAAKHVARIEANRQRAAAAKKECAA